MPNEIPEFPKGLLEAAKIGWAEEQAPVQPGAEFTLPFPPLGLAVSVKRTAAVREIHRAVFPAALQDWIFEVYTAAGVCWLIRTPAGWEVLDDDMVPPNLRSTAAGASSTPSHPAPGTGRPSL